MTNTPMHRIAALTVLTVLTCMTTAGCSGSATRSAPHGGSTQVAADTHQVTLRLGTDDGPETPGAQQIKHFAGEVARRSGGAVTIKPVWHADGGQPHWDQYVARMVMDGRLDLAMVPSRAWDDVGVESLRAMTAPFLVTTDSLTAKVVSDKGMVRRLTSGLPAVGVSALGLYPEGLRHPFGFHGPLRGAADYRGGVFRTAWSRGTNAMFASLGATTTDKLADTSSMVGAESSYRLSPAGVATGNVTFYPKVNVLVIDDKARQGLTNNQRHVLENAAGVTQAWVLKTLPTDGEAAATFCQETGKIASASQSDIDTLRAATRGVLGDLRKDPATATLINEIQSLAAGDPTVAPVTHCPKDKATTPSLVNGRFAFTMTSAQAIAAGVRDQDKIDENAGKYVVALHDGDWQITQVYTSGPKTGTTFHGTGGYTLSGHRLTWFWSHEPGEWTKVDVAVHKDGSLAFTAIHDGGDAQAQALSNAWFTHWPRTKD
jgi:TRAP-type C4-dicarboxylate transport system substrate-binding protein